MLLLFFLLDTGAWSTAGGFEPVAVSALLLACVPKKDTIDFCAIQALRSN